MKITYDGFNQLKMLWITRTISKNFKVDFLFPVASWQIHNSDCFKSAHEFYFPKFGHICHSLLWYYLGYQITIIFIEKKKNFLSWYSFLKCSIPSSALRCGFVSWWRAWFSSANTTYCIGENCSMAPAIECCWCREVSEAEEQLEGTNSCMNF